MPPPILKVAVSSRARRQAKKLDPAVARELAVLLEQLKQDPIPTSWRIHQVNGLWKADLLSNHSWQAAFRVVDGVAFIEYIGTHPDTQRFVLSQ